jgi:hypothetical protein
MRKLVIGFVSLCAVLGAYLLYNRISGSPSIDADQQVDIINSADDANAVGFDSEVGKIGDVGVGTTKKAYFTDLNEITLEIEREFGFEKLLSESRDIFDVEKPYMNIYRRNFKCYITADKGKVQVETAVGITTPKDATFSSNVVAHIFFGPPDDVKESFVYLDNFVFLSDRSRLSTAGPVKFVSDDILMNGTGLVLVYNEQSERLEYFEITDLESLHIEGSSAALFSTDNTGDDKSQSQTQPPDETLVVDKAPTAESSTTDVQPQDEHEEGVYYKCTFRKNVLVNTPDELIFAGNKLCIDIFWSKPASVQPAEDDTGTAKDNETVAESAKPEKPAAESTREQKIKSEDSAEPNVPSEQLKSIVVTCDGGFVVLPKDSVRAQEDAAADGVEEGASVAEFPDKFDNNTDRSRFLARRIDYDYTTGDGFAGGLSELTYYVGSTTGSDANEAPVPVKVTARKSANFSLTSNKIVFTECLVTMPQSGLTEPRDVTFSAPEITVNVPEDNSKKPDMFAVGPVELVFYMEDANSTDINRQPVPVTVNARKQARFLAASNQIVFEGDSRCTMLQEDPNTLEKYVLLSEQITVDLPADSNDGLSGPAAGIKHLTATGDVVRLAMTKTAKDQGAFAGQIPDANSATLLSGVELKCSRFDYDAARPEFLATGSGVIKLNNSEAREPNEPVGRFSMKKPCWASIEGFDTLRYFIRENRIVADAGSHEKILIDYFPAVDGRYDEHVKAEASHIEVLLCELPEGQTELLKLTATGGIRYEDKDNEFIGSKLFYDHKTAILKVNGDETHPCYYNGALVDGIEMNVETGKVKAEIVESGTLQIRR